MRPTLPRLMALSSDSIFHAKKAFRQFIKAKLSSLSEAAITQQSCAAQEALLAHPRYHEAKRISVYLAMPNGEARTEMIVADALSSGKTVFVPYIYRVPLPQTHATNGEQQGQGNASNVKRKAMEMLRLRSLSEWEGLERDSWGIPSLAKSSLDDRENAMGGFGLPTQRDLHSDLNQVTDQQDGQKPGLDLMIVPGVAFDGNLNRLGHGAGFYDYYLERFLADGTRSLPFLIGLCLSEQFLSPPNQVPTSDHDQRMEALAVGNGRIVEAQASDLSL